jgi:hypothetical protein
MVDFSLATYDEFEPWWVDTAQSIAITATFVGIVGVILGIRIIRSRLRSPRLSPTVFHALVTALVVLFLGTALVYHARVREPRISEYEAANPSSASGPFTVREASERYVRAQVNWAAAAISVNLLAIFVASRSKRQTSRTAA